LTLIVLF